MGLFLLGVVVGAVGLLAAAMIYSDIQKKK